MGRAGVVDDDGTPPDSPKATYAYDTVAITGTGNWNRSRVSSLTYPGGDVVPYDYGASSGDSDDRISRLTKLDVSGHPIGYDFIGLGMTAIVDYETPDVQLDRYRTHTGTAYTASRSLTVRERIAPSAGDRCPPLPLL